jgi:spoIIIJ-associated protein
MMKERSWEYVGRSVEEATQTALEELGLEPDDIYVEILEEPQKGFLGLGGKEARIRVELIGEWEVQGKKTREGENQASGFEAADEVETLDEPGPLAPTESSGKPRKMVEDVLGILEIDAMVEARERDDSVVVDVWGDDVAILIGKGGGTLDALQYLVNVGCRRTGDVTKKIIVDAEGYRKRRKAKLEKQAEQLAGKAISQRKSIEMNPMSASERKIVHMALRNIDGVWTESTGDDPERRVVINPGTQPKDVPRET